MYRVRSGRQLCVPEPTGAARLRSELCLLLPAAGREGRADFSCLPAFAAFPVVAAHRFRQRVRLVCR